MPYTIPTVAYDGTTPDPVEWANDYVKPAIEDLDLNRAPVKYANSAAFDAETATRRGILDLGATAWGSYTGLGELDDILGVGLVETIATSVLGTALRTQRLFVGSNSNGGILTASRRKVGAGSYSAWTSDTNVVKSVVVLTGSEPRPAADVVLWINLSNLTVTNADEVDVVFGGGAFFVPAGGDTGEVLTKLSTTDGDTGWAAGGGGGGGSYAAPTANSTVALASKQSGGPGTGIALQSGWTNLYPYWCPDAVTLKSLTMYSWNWRTGAVLRPVIYVASGAVGSFGNLLHDYGAVTASGTDDYHVETWTVDVDLPQGIIYIGLGYKVAGGGDLDIPGAAVDSGSFLIPLTIPGKNLPGGRWIMDNGTTDNIGAMPSVTSTLNVQGNENGAYTPAWWGALT